jgi:hypothetical protein
VSEKVKVEVRSQSDIADAALGAYLKDRQETLVMCRRNL